MKKQDMKKFLAKVALGKVILFIVISCAHHGMQVQDKETASASKYGLFPYDLSYLLEDNLQEPVLAEEDSRDAHPQDFHILMDDSIGGIMLQEHKLYDVSTTSGIILHENDVEVKVLNQ